MYNYLLLQLFGVIFIIGGGLFLLTKAGFWKWLIKKAKKTLKINFNQYFIKVSKVCFFY